jgi:uncharacterized lipoprotein YmbA
MIKLLIPRCRFLLFGLGLLFVLGCASSPPTRFYSLSSLQGGGSERGESISKEDPSIVVGPIKLPAYLDRPEIVTRSSSNEITFSDFNVWAGFLEEDFSRALAENLSALLSTESVTVYPRLRPKLTKYQIGVDVIRFDGPLGGDVSLIARWGIFAGKEKELVFARKSTILEPSGAKGYEAMVAAASRAVEKLSSEIAEAIKTLPK